jgi:antitoxin (DNA-binding transcriptional repressor) of toxin-antitoxin stability system
MRFVTIRDLRGNTARLRKELSEGREIVVTANGRPFALMTPVGPDSVEDEVLAIRRARAQAALGRMRQQATAAGLERLSASEIDAAIAEARRDRRKAE